jgi:hypothetical protein
MTTTARRIIPLLGRRARDALIWSARGYSSSPRGVRNWCESEARCALTASGGRACESGD